jgi:predicted glycoside hydrolase/deacetylase ChbG (UPF0249 family)
LQFLAILTTVSSAVADDRNSYHMVIINADDIGKNSRATNRTLECHTHGRITSTSAMVFMLDCEKSAPAILESGIDLGLHLNFTSKFDSQRVSATLQEYQSRIATFLLRSKYSGLLFHPTLSAAFEYSSNAQYEEFRRLFGRDPTHVDGHRHAHLCMNMLLGGYVPHGSFVRRSFTFARGEKSGLNRLYRRIVDSWLQRNYRCVDMFFSLHRYRETSLLTRIIDLSRTRSIELMVHPERAEEFEFLMGDGYAEFLTKIQRGTFSKLLSSP